ncbi:MAG: hypothetical protein V7646_1484 [Pseudonocardia sp.]
MLALRQQGARSGVAMRSAHAPSARFPLVNVAVIIAASQR